MSGIQNTNGKAFEYACLLALYKMLSTYEDVTVEDNTALMTARQKYSSLSESDSNKLLEAANAAARVIIHLEPQLEFPQNNIPLFLSIQTDAKGMTGDVRDVLCIRRQNQWQIGLSCKHNHCAVKHSRLSDTIDFGQDWFGTPCSQRYFNEIAPLFDGLRQLRDNARREGKQALWSELQNKAQDYYVPVLHAFIKELKQLAVNNPNVPNALIRYLLGRYDFYKIIADDKHKTTRIEAINLAGTLNRSSGKSVSIVNVPHLRLPAHFYHIDFKPSSDNTIEVICDEGWTISMRIHNASSKIEPSLKFDVNLVSLPNTIYAQVEPW